MALKLSPTQMAQYKYTALKRLQQERADLEQRYQQAWQLAREAAVLLKRDFNVQQVVLFGSLIYPDRFNRWSDIDLAAWGLTSKNWLKAMAAVRSLSEEIELNLVDVECCSTELLAVIEQEGVSL